MAEMMCIVLALDKFQATLKIGFQSFFLIADFVYILKKKAKG